MTGPDDHFASRHVSSIAMALGLYLQTVSLFKRSFQNNIKKLLTIFPFHFFMIGNHFKMHLNTTYFWTKNIFSIIDYGLPMENSKYLFLQPSLYQNYFYLESEIIL